MYLCTIGARTARVATRAGAGFLSALILLSVGSTPAPGAHDDPWMQPRIAYMKGPDGADLGRVIFTATPTGVLLTATLRGLPPGTFGMHIHENGVCEPDFKAVGGHYAPRGGQHGFLVDGGPHAGDLPNVHVPESGELVIQVFTERLSMAPNAQATLFDHNGSALVVDSGPDDYTSQPAGGGGEPIACGVIE